MRNGLCVKIWILFNKFLNALSIFNISGMPWFFSFKIFLLHFENCTKQLVSNQDISFVFKVYFYESNWSVYSDSLPTEFDWTFFTCAIKHFEIQDIKYDIHWFKNHQFSVSWWFVFSRLAEAECHISEQGEVWLDPNTNMHLEDESGEESSDDAISLSDDEGFDATPETPHLDGRVAFGVEMEPDTQVRLVRRSVAHLCTVDKKTMIYHSISNSRNPIDQNELHSVKLPDKVRRYLLIC